MCGTLRATPDVLRGSCKAGAAPSATPPTPALGRRARVDGDRPDDGEGSPDVHKGPHVPRPPRTIARLRVVLLRRPPPGLPGLVIARGECLTDERERHGRSTCICLGGHPAQPRPQRLADRNADANLVFFGAGGPVPSPIARLHPALARIGTHVRRLVSSGWARLIELHPGVLLRRGHLARSCRRAAPGASESRTRPSPGTPDERLAIRSRSPAPWTYTVRYGAHGPRHPARLTPPARMELRPVAAERLPRLRVWLDDERDRWSPA